MSNNVINMRTNSDEMYRNYQEEKLTAAITNNAARIARSLLRGADIEIRKSVNGVSIYEVRKKPVVR